MYILNQDEAFVRSLFDNGIIHSFVMGDFCGMDDLPSEGGECRICGAALRMKQSRVCNKHSAVYGAVMNRVRRTCELAKEREHERQNAAEI